MRPSVRLAALSDLDSIFVWTHDSIALGEDGPTHEPVEHLASLRAIPNLLVIRPADANETVEAWRTALRHASGPVALVLSRQKLPIFDRTALGAASGAARGGYVLADPAGGAMPEVILIATGSEVSLALEAHARLGADGVKSRVVSLPCWELFDAQPQAYRDEVLPPAVRARVTVEAGATLGWERYAGDAGVIIGLDRFGASGPGPVVMRELGFTVDRVVAAAKPRATARVTRRRRGRQRRPRRPNRGDRDGHWRASGRRESAALPCARRGRASGWTSSTGRCCARASSRA